eukprot:CAMPEP_0169431024 /NCGR_PEP_ID=MMETSP1042-20121227/2715_1 /TAXON_ID=464988 /ORGANISM="Hemiselmis andersenii, Strain CCMP1180" /LENGTH=584 /DNA_ID=CAMNT_0009541385 /DNA_START=125 /DNA_END=1876 /DNA_ORIENTATION=-
MGEVTCVITRLMGLGEDYIYQMLAFRAMRVFRIVKLTKHLTGLKNLTTRAFGSPAGVLYSMLVTIVFIVFYSLFGNSLFRANVEFAERRDDFQYIFAAMKCMIEFLFGDLYFQNIETGYQEGDIIGIMYWIVYFYVANFLVLRIFIALIMENFEYTEDQKIRIQIMLFQKDQIRRNDLVDGNAKAFPVDDQWQRLRKQNLDEEHLMMFQKRWEEVVRDRAAESSSTTTKQLWDIIIEAYERKAAEAAFFESNMSFVQKVLLYVKKALQKAVYTLVEDPRFGLFVAAVIVFSVVLLQVDPTDAPIIYPPTRQLIDQSLLIFFATEVGLRMFAFGVFTQSGVSPKTTEFPQGKPPFFSASEEGGWNTLDFCFIMVMLIDVLPNGISLGGFKTVRVVRVLRPLQKNSPTVKNLIATVFASFSSIMHVINLLGLLILLFGLMGVQLFRGRLHSCNDPAVANFKTCIGNNFGGHPRTQCDFMDPEFPNGTMCESKIGKFLQQEVLVPRVWEPPLENFENLGAASICILRLLAMDNLQPIFHSVMDTPRNTRLICPDGSMGNYGCDGFVEPWVVTNQPRPNNRPENVLFP